MGITLRNYEWQFLLQLVTRINYCRDYEEVCNILSEQLPTVIPCCESAFFRTGRKGGKTVISDMRVYSSFGELLECPYFSCGEAPYWAEYIMSSHSYIFRQSDLIPINKWKGSSVYNKIWKPQNIYWGLMVSVIYKDAPLVLLGLFREEDASDFTERDKYVLHQILNVLELKFYDILGEGKKEKKGMAHKIISEVSARFHLTKRETEIVQLICDSCSSEDICQRLVISKATLSKHLTNIYAKTMVKNRTGLLKLFSDNIYGDS